MSGNTKGYRRRFGAVRRLPSGRWQARYPGRDGRLRTADRTFTTKREAEIWLTKTEAEILGENWADPDAGKIPFRTYAEAWLQERVLRPKTMQLYEGLLRLHINPNFGDELVAEITSRQVRQWHVNLVQNGPGASTAAKAYRLLRTILNTALEDGAIRRNPCRIKGAGIERPAERPILTVEQLYRLVAAMPPRSRLLVLLATFCSMRWGELAALRRAHIDVAARTVRVEASINELKDGSLVTGPPKTEAGIRVIAIPEVLVGDLRWHLQRFADPEQDGLVFIGGRGAPLRRSNFSGTWAKALIAAELPPIHFHDLRHTGNTFAAMTGATMRELMSRMGHASPRAALIYLHATSDRDRAVADAMGTFVRAQLQAAEGDDDSGDGDPSVNDVVP